MNEVKKHANVSGSEALIRLARPAAEWIEGLPLANGISAVMVWGGSSRTVLSLNHVDFWRNNLKQEEPEAWPDLHAARELMLAGRAAEANDVYDQRFLPRFKGLMPGQQPGADPGIMGYTNIFCPIGDLVIEWDGEHPSDGIRRQLDLRDGIASAAWPCGTGETTWESFVPAREDVILFSFHSPVPLSGRFRFERMPQPSHTLTGRLLPDGLLALGAYPEGVRSACRARLDVGSGTLTPDAAANAILLRDVRSLRLWVAVEAGQGDRDLAADCERKVTAAIQRNEDDIRSAHQAEHRSFFGRASFRLDAPRSSGETDRLLAVARNGIYDPRLAELSFQFGRYLIMACNRAGRRPANLQGIWNRNPATVWDADWHPDMNIEMNHWLCNPTHLDECNLALFRQFDAFMEAGRRMARRVAGCDGILWYLAGGDGMAWVEDHCCGFWVGAASWIAQHYWTHYEYTQDREF
ncbi:MAG: glycoside hydrolase N-terminal domain-containing protein, partial [bacterium]